MLKANVMPNPSELRPIGEHPEFASAEATMRRLRAKAAEIEAELAEVETELQTKLLQALEDDSDRAARALLAGDDDGDAIEPLQNRAARLRRDLATHRRAVALHAATVGEARDKATAEAALAMVPEHRAAVGSVLAALDRLRDAMQAERNIRTRLSEAGYQGGLRDFTPPKFILAENDLVVTSWLRDARAYAK